MQAEVEKAWELIAIKRRWTWGSMSRDKRGNFCSPFSPDAYCWCASGAIAVVYQGSQEKQLEVLGKIGEGIREKYPDIDNIWRKKYGREEVTPTNGQLISFVNDEYGYEVIFEIMKEKDV